MNDKSTTEKLTTERNETSKEEKKLDGSEDVKRGKEDQKPIPEFAFSIDGPPEDDLKNEMTITIDRRTDEAVHSDSVKAGRVNTFNKWKAPATTDGPPINAMLLRRKIEAERNIAILKEEEMERFNEEEARRMKELEERSRFLAEQERLLEMELNASNEEKERQIREERERLEQARLLREEQLRIDRLHELNKGDAQKIELERREQINEQLEQLAERERKQHEFIAQQEMEQRMREKAVKMVLLNAVRNTNNVSLPKGVDSADPLRTVPKKTNILTTRDPVRAPSTNNGIRLSRTQCDAIRKFARVFQMANPAVWVRENCPFAKQYFPKASCSQIQQLFESCFQRT
ncbi:hypothetical protein Tcan_17409 [Toxocara canis]|nr:hypothetical protein Tcan_17409 [Toxocara canis]